MTRAKNISRIYVAIFMVYFIPRILGLGSDISNLDASRWYPRMDRFTKNLLRGDYKGTYQKYHPGVTMLWTSGTSKYLFEKGFETFLGFNPRYMPQQFPRMNFAAKFPLVLIISIIGVAIFHFLAKIADNIFALIFSIVLSLEPFFLGISRFLHLSALTAMFMFLSFIMLYWYYENPRKNVFKLGRNTFNPPSVSAIILGLGVLTKIDALIAGPVIGAFIIFKEFQLSNKNHLRWIMESAKKGLKYLIFMSLTIYSLFPAMWVAPKWTILKIVHKGLEDTAFSDPGGKTILGPRYLFYPENVVFRSSPVLTIGILTTMLLLLLHIKNYNNFSASHKNLTKLVLWSAFYALITLTLLSIPSKLKDRYLVDLYPPLSVLTTSAIYLIYTSNKKLLKKFAIGVLVVFYITTFYRYHPVYSFYYSELIGGQKGLERIGLNVVNRGEYYAQAAQFINNYDDSSETKNVVLAKRELSRSFSPFFLGETFTNPKFMKNGYYADYIVTTPKLDYLIPNANCTFLKSFGPRNPLGYEMLKVYKCEGIQNDYKSFKN